MCSCSASLTVVARVGENQQFHVCVHIQPAQTSEIQVTRDRNRLVVQNTDRIVANSAGRNWAERGEEGCRGVWGRRWVHVRKVHATPGPRKEKNI